MPLYEYRCEACGHVFEQIQKFSDPPIDVCPKCGERKVEKLLSSPAIQFKGTGWYITDYARKGKDKDKGTDKGPDAAAKPGGTEAKPASADSKSSSSDSSSSSTSASDSTGKTPAPPSSSKEP